MDPSIIVVGIAVLAIVCVSLLVRHLRREHGHLDALKAEIEAAKRRDDQESSE